MKAGRGKRREGRNGKEREREKNRHIWPDLQLVSEPVVPASPAVSSAPEDMINVYELAKLWFVLRLRAFHPNEAEVWS